MAPALPAALLQPPHAAALPAFGDHGAFTLRPPWECTMGRYFVCAQSLCLALKHSSSLKTRVPPGQQAHEISKRLSF